MDTNTINYLIKTVRAGSINKAAQQLYMNHQHLGKKLSQMENELGIKILKRTKTGIDLTDDGRIIYEKLLEINEAMQEVSAYINVLQNNKKMEDIIERDLTIYLSSSIFPKRASKAILKVEEQFPSTKVTVEESSYNKSLEQIYQQENAFAHVIMTMEQLENIPQDISVLFKREYDLVAYIPKHMLDIKFITNPLEITNYLLLPIILYSAYDVQENIIWQELNKYGKPNFRHTTKNYMHFQDMMYQKKYVTVGWYSDSTKYYEGDEFSNFMLDNEEIAAIPLVYKQKRINAVSAWLCRKDAQLMDEVKYFKDSL